MWDSDCKTALDMITNFVSMSLRYCGFFVNVNKQDKYNGNTIVSHTDLTLPLPAPSSSLPLLSRLNEEDGFSDSDASISPRNEDVTGINHSKSRRCDKRILPKLGPGRPPLYPTQSSSPSINQDQKYHQRRAGPNHYSIFCKSRRYVVQSKNRSYHKQLPCKWSPSKWISLTTIPISNATTVQ